jgi:hypothetical protein
LLSDACEHSPYLDDCIVYLSYVFKKIIVPLAPFTLALVLGNRAEDAFRLSMIGSGGDMKMFWSNGLVGSITTLAIVLLFWPVIDKAFGANGLSARSVSFVLQTRQTSGRISGFASLSAAPRRKRSVGSACHSGTFRHPRCKSRGLGAPRAQRNSELPYRRPARSTSF